MSARFAVLADDLTGAAEIAGIGVEFGLPSQVARAPVVRSDADLIVFDTDTRQLSPADAADRIKHVLTQWLPKSHDVLYKKTDSILRGNVASELGAMLESLGVRRAMLVPQNPSMGRVVVDGEYRIDGIPLDQTSFRDDPHHPRTTARVRELIGDDDRIDIPDGQSREDLLRLSKSNDVLFAGGADFFRAILAFRGFAQHNSSPLPLAFSRTLIVCGSASSQSRQTVGEWIRAGRSVCESGDNWTVCAREQFNTSNPLILAITEPVDPSQSQRLQNEIAQTTAGFVRESDDALNLWIEGGSTAAAIVEALHWGTFRALGNLAPGVVALQPDNAAHVRLILKPGSYPWPRDVIRQFPSP
jgi:D-threonate/D-erythronate kinase